MKKKKEIEIIIENASDFNKVENIDREKCDTVVLYIKHDIDFKGVDFKPIDASNLNVIIVGESDRPNRRPVLNNLTIDNKKGKETGIFSRVKSIAISNVNMANFDIKGDVCTGMLAGSVDRVAVVENCGVTGSVEATAYCGSLFGTVGRLRLEDTIICTEVTGRDIIGGVVGIADSVKGLNAFVKAKINAAIGKAQGQIVGYNSSENSQRVMEMLADTLPLLEPKPTLEEMELIRHFTTR